MGAIFTAAAEQWQIMKSEFDAAHEVAYRLAETETNGNLVNRAGRERGIHPLELFSRGRSFAHKYASWELLEHWRKHPRITLEQFEAQWVTGRLEHWSQ